MEHHREKCIGGRANQTHKHIYQPTRCECCGDRRKGLRYNRRAHRIVFTRWKRTAAIFGRVIGRVRADFLTNLLGYEPSSLMSSAVLTDGRTTDSDWCTILIN